ncbi:TPA: hypothetical protein ACWV6T_004294 [Salmonella enterica subsp. enterica serovar Muenchen]
MLGGADNANGELSSYITGANKLKSGKIKIWASQEGAAGDRLDTGINCRRPEVKIVSRIQRVDFAAKK